MTYARIDAVNLENRLRDVETDGRDRLHDLAHPNRGGLIGTHIHGTYVPVEEPSTASIADTRISGDQRNIPLRSKPLDLRELETKRYRGRLLRPPTMRLWQAAQ